MRKFILAVLIVLSMTMGFDALALAPVTASPWTTTTNPATARTGLVVYSTGEVDALITAATNGLVTSAITNGLLTTNGNGQFLTNLQAANIVGTLTNNTTGNASTATTASFLSGPVTNTAGLLPATNGIFSGTFVNGNLGGTVTMGAGGTLTLQSGSTLNLQGTVLGTVPLATTASYAGTSGTTTNLSGGALNLSTNIANGQIAANRCVTNGANVSLLVNDAGYLTNSAAFQPTNVNLTTLATLNGGSLTNLNALNITNLAATIGAQVGSSNYLTSASSLNYTKLTNAPTITTNYLVTIGSTNGYSTYVTNANGSIAATFIFTNLAGLSVAASAVTGTLTNNTSGNAAGATNLYGNIPTTQVTGLGTAAYSNAAAFQSPLTYQPATNGAAIANSQLPATLTNNTTGSSANTTNLVGASASTTLRGLSGSASLTTSGALTLAVTNQFTNTVSISGDGAWSNSTNASGVISWVHSQIPTVTPYAVFNPTISSNILYVATNGNDSTAVRGNINQKFSTFTNAVTHASVGDVIYIYSGSYWLNSSGTLVPAGVQIVGDTNGSTPILALWQAGNNFVAGIVLTNNLVIANININCSNTPSGYDTYPLYLEEVPVITSQTPTVPTVTCTNVFLYNVTVNGYSDALFVVNKGVLTGTALNCTFNSYYDGANIQMMSMATNWFVFQRCAFHQWPGAAKYANAYGDPSRGIAAQGISIFVSDCTFDEEDGQSADGYSPGYNVAFSVNPYNINLGGGSGNSTTFTAERNVYNLHSTNCISQVYSVYQQYLQNPTAGNVFNTDLSAPPNLIATTNTTVNVFRDRMALLGSIAYSNAGAFYLFGSTVASATNANYATNLVGATASLTARGLNGSALLTQNGALTLALTNSFTNSIAVTGSGTWTSVTNASGVITWTFATTNIPTLSGVNTYTGSNSLAGTNLFITTPSSDMASATLGLDANGRLTTNVNLTVGKATVASFLSGAVTNTTGLITNIPSGLVTNSGSATVTAPAYAMNNGTNFSVNANGNGIFGAVGITNKNITANNISAGNHAIQLNGSDGSASFANNNATIGSDGVGEFAGVYGESSVDVGVSGYSAVNVGVFGESSVDVGVSGYSSVAEGVSGYSANSSKYGIYGTSAGGHGVWSDGDLKVTTSASFANGAVTIDGSGNLTASSFQSPNAAALWTGEWTYGAPFATYTPVQGWSSLGFGGRFDSVNAVGVYASSENGLAAKLIQKGWTAPIGTNDPVVRIWRDEHDTNSNASADLEIFDRSTNSTGAFLLMHGANGATNSLNKNGSAAFANGAVTIDGSGNLIVGPSISSPSDLAITSSGIMHLAAVDDGGSDVGVDIDSGNGVIELESSFNSTLVGIGTGTPYYTLDVNGDLGNSASDSYYFSNGNGNYVNGNNNGNFGVGTTSPQYILDVNGNIGNSGGDFNVNSASGEYNFNSGDTNSTYAHINLVTQGGYGQCALNFYTYGGEAPLSDTPAATWKFSDNGNYAGQNIFYSAIGGSSTSGQRPLLGIGAGTSANTVQGVGIGTDYAAGHLLPNNGLVVEGFTGIGTLTPKAQLDVNGTSHFSSYMTNDANIYVAGSVNEAAKDVAPHLTTSSATSGTVTASTSYWNETIYLSSGSTITSITIALPSSSTLVGQIYRVHTKSIVTTLSVTGGSFADAAVITLTAGQTIAYQAQSTSGAYIRIQ